VPASAIALIIGKAGKNIKDLEAVSGGVLFFLIYIYIYIYVSVSDLRISVFFSVGFCVCTHLCT